MKDFIEGKTNIFFDKIIYKGNSYYYANENLLSMMIRIMIVIIHSTFRMTNNFTKNFFAHKIEVKN